MKRFLLVAAIAAVTIAPPALAADVGVSISIGQPGFYGHLDIGDFPRPQLYYPEPIVVEQVQVVRPPIYLRVPPGHRKHWNKHCREYNACGERVLFVRDDWYDREYVPRYQEKHRDHQDDNKGHDRGHSKKDRHGKDKGHGHNR